MPCGEGAGKADGAAADWSRFRGPNGTGIAASGEFPAEIGPERNVLWKSALPPGRSSPVLSHARLFLTALEGEELVTLAFERDGGKLAWKHAAPRPRRTRFHADNHPAAPSAAVDADTVVVFFDEFGLLAYDHDFPSYAEGVVIPAGLWGKVKTTVQIVAISLLIIYERLGELERLAPLSLWLALIVSVYSGLEYFVRFGRLVLRGERPPGGA